MPESVTRPAPLDRPDVLDLADVGARDAIVRARVHLDRVPDVDGEDGLPVSQDLEALLGLEGTEALEGGLGQVLGLLKRRVRKVAWL